MQTTHQRSFEEIIGAFPDLSFWYHISPQDLVRTPRVILEKYIEALPRLKHEQIRGMVLAAQWPWISDDQVREDLWDILNDKPILTWQERAMMPGRILPEAQFFPTLQNQGFRIERMHVEGGMKWPPEEWSKTDDE